MLVDKGWYGRSVSHVLCSTQVSLSTEDVMQQAHDRRSPVARIGSTLLLLGALVTMGGCVHISQRALMNGQGVSNGNAGQGFVYGRHDFSAQRQLYGRLDYLRHGQYQQVPYPYFGHW